MSYILAGLATGIGQGITKQAEIKAAEQEAERKRAFDIALENLRTKNGMKVDNNQAELNDRNTQREYGYRDQLADKDLGRDLKKIEAETDARLRTDNNAAENDIRLARVHGDRDAALIRLKAQIDSGEVVDTLLSESGEYVGITNRGQRVNTGVFAHSIDTTPRPTVGLGNSALFPELEQGAPAPTPTPTPRATPTARATSSPAPRATPASNRTPQPQMIDGVYRALTDAQAEVFVNNPANKGKRFVGPDGKTYTVQ